MALISRIETEPESSIQRFAWESRSAASCSRRYSAMGRKPLRRLEKSIEASDESMRMISERVVISSENTATRLAWSTAALRAMFSAKAVFPMLGRAAMMISSPGCSPPVISSRSPKPVGRPESAPARFMMPST